MEVRNNAGFSGIRHPWKNAEVPERLHGKPFISNAPGLNPLKEFCTGERGP